MIQHADGCECGLRARDCKDTPKGIPTGWKWDGTGDLGLWALGLMSPGRHAFIDGKVAEIRGYSDGEHTISIEQRQHARHVIVREAGKRKRYLLSADDLGVSVEKED